MEDELKKASEKLAKRNPKETWDDGYKSDPVCRPGKRKVRAEQFAQAEEDVQRHYLQNHKIV